MARYDVHRRRDSLLLNCQSDLLPHLDTRLVVPLVTYSPTVVIAPKLNPTFTFDGRKLVMLTNLAGAVRLRDMGPSAGSLAEHDQAIQAAFDFLMSGF